MTDVCQKLEQVVKRNFAPNSRCSANIQKVITGWGKTIREDFELKNLHMIHKDNATGLQMLQNGIQTLVNIVKDAKSALDDSVEHFSLNTDQYEQVQIMYHEIVTMFKNTIKSPLLTTQTQHAEEDTNGNSDNEEDQEEIDDEKETENDETELEEEEAFEEEEEEEKQVETKEDKRGKKRPLKTTEKKQGKLKLAKGNDVSLVRTGAVRTNIDTLMKDIMGKHGIPTFVTISRKYGTEAPSSAFADRRNKHNVSNVQIVVRKCPNLTSVYLTNAL